MRSIARHFTNVKVFFSANKIIFGVTRGRFFWYFLIERFYFFSIKENFPCHVDERRFIAMAMWEAHVHAHDERRMDLLGAFYLTKKRSVWMAITTRQTFFAIQVEAMLLDISRPNSPGDIS